MVVGLLPIRGSFTLLFILQNQKHGVGKFKDEYLALVLSLVVVFLHYLTQLHRVFLYWGGIVCILNLLHASKRLRNVKHQLTYASEALEFAKNPLGKVLHEVGI